MKEQKNKICNKCAGIIDKGKDGFKGFGGGRYSPYCICINGKNPFKEE